MAAAVGVKYRAWFDTEVARSHADRIHDERGLVVVIHGPPDHGFGVAVYGGGEIHPPFPGGGIGYPDEQRRPPIGTCLSWGVR
jgi:hypothetical protein